MENGIGETQLEYLKQQISDRLRGFNSDAYYYGRKSKVYQASMVIIGALITILSGMKFHFTQQYAPDVISFVVLVLGAISTVAAFFGSFLSPQQCWLLSQDSYNKMRALQAKIEFEEKSPTFASRLENLVEAYFAEYQGILDEQNRRWLEIRGKNR